MTSKSECEKILNELEKVVEAQDFSFYEHLIMQKEFSLKTFGPGMRTNGVIDHIKSELIEIAEYPTDIVEWIDVVLLALDGAWRAGASPEQIIDALRNKQAKNMKRQWPKWEDVDPNAAINHIQI